MFYMYIFWSVCLLLIAQPDDLCDIDIWISMSIIYTSIPMTKKYSTTMCQFMYVNGSGILREVFVTWECSFCICECILFLGGAFLYVVLVLVHFVFVVIYLIFGRVYLDLGICIWFTELLISKILRTERQRN